MHVNMLITAFSLAPPQVWRVFFCIFPAWWRVANIPVYCWGQKWTYKHVCTSSSSLWGFIHGIRWSLWVFPLTKTPWKAKFSVSGGACQLNWLILIPLEREQLVWDPARKMRKWLNWAKQSSPIWSSRCWKDENRSRWDFVNVNLKA